MEREKPRSRKKKRLGVKFWAAVCGGIAVAAAATVTALCATRDRKSVVAHRASTDIR